MNKVELLRSFAEMIAIPLSNTDSIKWPVRSGQIISHVGDIYAKEYMRQLRVLTNCYPPSEWKEAFTNSLNLWKVSHHLINGLCKAGFSREQIAEDVLLIASVLNELNGSRPFSKYSHLIWPDNEVERIFEYTMFEKKELCTLVHLFSVIWAYSDSLFFQGREICCEQHGLYQIDKHTQLLISDTKEINEYASIMWNDTFSPLPFSSIRIALLYDENFSISIDAYNNIDLQSGSFIDSCKGGILLLDGEPIHGAQITELFSDLVHRIEHQVKDVNHLSKEDLIAQYIRIFWLRKKKLAEKTHEPWLPKESIFSIVYQNYLSNTTYNEKVASLEKQLMKYDYSSYLR